MVRPASVLHVLGALLVLFALSMLVPLCVSFLYGDGAGRAHSLGILATFAAGAVLWGATRGARGELQPRDALLLVALVWTVLPGFATLPLLLHLPSLSFTDAYFEA